MPGYRPKPSARRARRQAARLPAGCRLYLPLLDGAGTKVRDFSGQGFDGTLVGAPAWQSGPYGAQLGNFSTSNYVAVDPPQQVYGAAWPSWLAVLGLSTSTADGTLISQTISTSATAYVAIRWNVGGAGRVAAFIVSPSGTVEVTISVTGWPTTDGQPHVTQFASYSATDHRLYFDGVLIGTSSAATTIAASGYDRLTLGLLRRATSLLPSPGSVLAAAGGNGATPDPARLAQDWLSGTFRAVRPPTRSRAVFDRIATATPATLAAAGIPSAEAFGVAALATSSGLAAPGIPSAEGFGVAAVSTSASLAADGIPTAESWGLTALVQGIALAAAGIPSAESFGVAALATGTVALAAAGIPSAESWGVAAISGPAAVVAVDPASWLVLVTPIGPATAGGPPAASPVIDPAAWIFLTTDLAPAVVVVPPPPGPGVGMFPEALYPGLFFPRALFPRPAAASPFPADLLMAIVAAMRADPTLSALVGGRAYRGPRAPRSAVTPFVVATDLTVSITDWFEFAEQRTSRVQFDIWANTDADAAEIAAAVVSLFQPRPGWTPLAFAGGSETLARLLNLVKLDEPRRGPGDRPLRHFIVDYAFVWDVTP